jgi:uncharacterized repeat protein (TIGR02543 family)
VVTFDPGGGELREIPTTQKADNGSIILPIDEPTKDGYKFTGWKIKDGDGKIYEPGDIIEDIDEDITLVAQWEKSYTVTVTDSFAGSTGEGSYEAGDTVTIAAGSKTGYIFEGWIIDGVTVGDADSQRIIFTMPANNVTATAKWKENVYVPPPATYTVRYYGNGGNLGEILPMQIVEEKTPFTLPEEEPTRTGYEFKGWNTQQDGLGTAYAAGDPVDIIGNISFYAQWEKVEFDVTFVSNGGSAVVPQKVIKGRPVDERSAASTKPGYALESWYKDKELTNAWDFAKNEGVTDDITLYAKWALVDYDIEYYLNDEYSGEAENDPENPTNYTIKDSKSIKDPVWAGYIFIGWTCEELGIDEPLKGVTIPENTTGTLNFTANWIPRDPGVYEIKYNMDGGTNHKDNKGYYIAADLESNPVVIQEPSKTGYTFKGWIVEYSDMPEYDEVLTDPDAPYIIPADAEGDVTFKATWDINQYTVTFMDDETEYDTKTVDYKTAVGLEDMPSEPSKPGYIFKGWNTKPDGTGDMFTDTTEVTDEITVYAVWEKEAVAVVTKYTVTFMRNYDASDDTILDEVDVDDEDSLGEYMPFNPARTGYIFKGWNTKPDGTGNVFTSATDVTGETTVYAIWEYIGESGNVGDNTGGGGVIPPPLVTEPTTEPATQPETTTEIITTADTIKETTTEKGTTTEEATTTTEEITTTESTIETIETTTEPYIESTTDTTTEPYIESTTEPYIEPTTTASLVPTATEIVTENITTTVETTTQEKYVILTSLGEIAVYKTMPSNAIPLSNGWFAMALGDGIYQIFDKTGVTLGLIKLADGISIEDWDDFGNIIPIAAPIPEATTEDPKNNPRTGDNLIFILIGLLILCGSIAIIARKRLKIKP